MKILHVIVLLCYLFLSIIGTFYKSISFGWGLGDMIGYVILYSMTIAYVIIFLKIIRSQQSKLKYVTIFFLGIFVWIVLQATLLRGAEYRWNGNFFYEFEIINKK